MEVKNVLRQNPTKVKKANLAVLWNNDHLIIRNTPYKSSAWGSGISLKDISYAIVEGILYISGKQIEWDSCGESISQWKSSLMNYHEINENFINNHEIPDDIIIRNFKKRVWFFFHKTYPIIINTTMQDSLRFKRKKESDFNLAVNPFKLQENE